MTGVVTTSAAIAGLSAQITGLQALLQGTRDKGLWYAIYGNSCIFGCQVTASSPLAPSMYLALDGTLNSEYLNPTLVTPNPTRPENYANIAVVYGEVALLDQQNTTTLNNAALVIGTAPGTGYSRIDVVYIYVGTQGPALGIAQGTSSAGAPTVPAIPAGTMALAQVAVGANATQIVNANITDLRNFTGRQQAAINTAIAQITSAANLFTANKFGGNALGTGL